MKNLLTFALSFCLVFSTWSINVNSEGVLNYTGNVENTNYGAATGSGQAASAIAEMEYDLGDVVAIAVSDNSGNLPSGPDSIFKDMAPEILNNQPIKYLVDDPQAVAQDIITSADVSSPDDFVIFGVAFSSRRSMFMGFYTNNGTGDYVTLQNQATSDQISVRLVSFIYGAANYGAYINNMMYLAPSNFSSNPGFEGTVGFSIYGDIDESTVTTADRPGLYTGTLYLGVVNL